MELLYVYAKEYRLFKNQEFRFSDRFIVDYNAETNCLKITQNKNYFDIYPGNIRSISAIVGRNAAGKTSLLSLIGDREQERDREGGNYFLLYYDGKNDNGYNFILETIQAKHYIQAFSGIAPKQAQIARGKGRELRAFRLISEDLSQFLLLPESTPSPWAMISFRTGNFPPKENFNEENNRHYARMKTDSLFDETNFLAVGMLSRRKSSSLYRQKAYTMELEYTPKQNILSPRISKNFPDLSRRLNLIDSQIQASFISAQKNQYLLRESMLQYILSIQLKGILEINRHIYLSPTSLEINMNHLIDFSSAPSLTEILVNASLAAMDGLSQSDFHDISHHCINQQRLIALRELLEHVHITPQLSDNKSIFLLKYKITEDTFRNGKYDKIATKKRMDRLQALPAFHNTLKWKIKGLSRGERENLSMFTAINDQIHLSSDTSGNKFILLFDEIERSMHPNMCRCLIDDLTKFLSRYEDKEFQIIIATHSPFLLGDLRKQNVICLEEGGKVQDRKDQQESFGQNIHSLLKSQFFLDNTFSEYAVRIIRLISECLKMDSLADMRAMIHSRLNDDFADKRLPQTDDETRQFLSSLINSIGEPLIRCSLEEKLQNWDQRPPMQKQARMEWYLRKAKELEEEIQKEGQQ